MSPRIDVRGIPARQAASVRAAARVAALEVLPPASRAHVTFSDDNGPKGGPAIRCAVTLTVPRRRLVHIEAAATTPRLALDAALAKVERRLIRTRSLARDSRRHPKKYYAAARAAIGR
jgi:ribosome-associated translation inhibitor RaiA